MHRIVLSAVIAFSLPSLGSAQSQDLYDQVQHHYASSDGVGIHYVTYGEGPLVVMVHGFPDFWYTWRDQMTALARAGYRVAAMDLRGYNRSDQPRGVESYAMGLLVQDVVSVIAAEGADQAVVVGHDWGGMIAWQTALSRPDLVERLIILNLPHPAGLTRELANNPQQQANSQYARNFQRPGAHEALTAEGLARWVTPDARPRYLEAFERSDFEGMLNFYKANYPREPYQEMPRPIEKVQMPVLMFHGLADLALLAAALNDTWEWLEQDLTLVTIPGAGHFVQHDASELVTRSMMAWLGR